MLSPIEILSIFEHNSNFNQTSTSIQRQQSAALCKAFSKLDYYFLMEPHVLTQDFKPYIHQIFNNPPDNEVMELCTKCIISALNSDITMILHPSEFPYLSVMPKARNPQFSDNVILNLLEIIFTLTIKQENYIQKVDISDIKYFVKYFYMLPIPSKINCLKCINQIISFGIDNNYFQFLPNLFDIANSSENDNRIYSLTTNIIISMLRHFNKQKFIKCDQYDVLNYCQKLCNYTANYRGTENLNVLIDSLYLCSFLFYSAKNIILNNINLSTFIYCHPDEEIFLLTLKLIYSLIPLPKSGLKGLVDYHDYIGLSSNTGEIFEKSKSQIQNVFPCICDYYVSDLKYSKECLEMIVTLVYGGYFNLKFPNKLLYMLYFRIDSDKNLIAKVVNEGLKIAENFPLIQHSGIIDIICEKISNDSLHSSYPKIYSLVKSTPKPTLPSDTQLFDFSNISDLVRMIDQNPLFQLDFFSYYFKKLKLNQHVIEIYKIFDLFKNFENLDTIEIESQKVVTFLLQLLADIPIPCQLDDKYYNSYYDELLNDKINLYCRHAIPFNSILSECIQDENYNLSKVNELIIKDEELNSLIDKSMLTNDELPGYTLSVLYRELDKQRKRQFIFNDDIRINDSDQFVLTITPQIFNRTRTFRFSYYSEYEKLDYHTSGYANGTKPTKKNTICKHLFYFLGDEIVENILRLLNYIQYKDKNHLIEFIHEPFLENVLYQLQYLYLDLGIYSPCSQMMLKYPFLFDIGDRLFLFKLLIKEPLMAKDFYLKKYNPNYNAVKREPYSVLKFAVSRENIFKDGIVILKRFAKYRSVFEIKFKGEKGYGKGPTKEFFHLMSKEFCKKRHRLWRRDNFSTDESVNDFKRLYAHNKQGLFPYATANSKYMYYLGLFIAKAIQMEEVIDIPFNPAFFDIVNDKEISLKDVDETLYNSLNDPSAEEALLDFPFQANVEGKNFDLVKNGDKILVNHENFNAFKREMEKFVCGKHVRKVIDFFIDGFAEVLDPTLLNMFSGKEIIELINGQRELFTADELSKFIVCGNGYDMKSPQIINLIDVVTNFDKNYQKLFLQFVTGSPFLPIGGLQALDPPINVIRKYAQNSRIQDEHYLPSSQTCINALYLPPYPTKEIMRDKIIMVITECVESFELF